MPDAVEFQDATGVVHPLTDTHTFVPAGMQGRFMPTYTFYEDILAGVAGSMGRNIHTNSREVTVPIFMVADDESALRDRIRTFSQWCDPTLGPGILRTSAVDGSQRELNCVYKSGHEGVEVQGRTGCSYYMTAVVFHAYDPYWYDTETEVITARNTAAAGAFFKNPFFPITLSSSAIYSGMYIPNDGDVETWPVWTITGPGTTPTLIWDDGVTTMQVNATLLAGDQMVIDTRPGYKTVMMNGVSYFQYIPTYAGNFFPLHTGINFVQLSMGGTTNASSLSVTYRNRYNSA